MKTRLAALLMAVCILLVSGALASDVGGRPYQPRPGRYEMENVPGDYVMLDYANTDGIRFTVVFSGIYSMRQVEAPFSNYSYYFTYYDGEYTIRGCASIDGVVFDLNITEVTGPGELKDVLRREGYLNATFMYNDFSRYSSGYFEQFGYYSDTGYRLYDHGTTFYVPEYPDDGNRGGSLSSGPFYARAADKLATRSGPGTNYSEPGTFFVKGQMIEILAKHQTGSTLWVKCRIPYRGKYVTAWTGWKRFDHSTLNIDLVPWE